MAALRRHVGLHALGKDGDPMFQRTSTTMILLGVLAIIVGVVALAWPRVTILALVILLAVSSSTSAALQVMGSFPSARAGPVIGLLLLAVIDVVAAVFALAWPG